MTTRRPELRALTGLRFLAALWVLAFHTTRVMAADVPILGPLVSIGYVGVSLFFVLSGFILVYTYWSEDKALNTPAFLWHRVARVLPVYWLAWLIAGPFVVRHLPDSERLTTGALSFTLLQAWVPQAACKWNCPGWSLSAEACFYLAFPVLLIAVRRSPVRTAVIAFVAWVVAMFIAAGTIGLDPQSTPYLAVEYNPLLRVPEFVAGMLIGRWYVRGGRLPEWLSGYWVGAGALLACVVASAWPRPLLYNGLLAPLFLLVVLTLAPGGGFLASAPLRRLGQASYALYLLHLPLYSIAYHAGERLGMPVARSPVVWLAYALSSIAISWQVLIRVEEPARSWLRRLEGRLRRTEPQSAT